MATRASTDMGGDGMALIVKRTGRERRELDVGGMMLGRHNISPSKAGAVGLPPDRRCLAMRPSSGPC